MTDIIFTEMQNHNICGKKYHMKNDIPNVPSQLHISHPNLLSKEFHHIITDEDFH